MTWLGHHEFGQDHRPFVFDEYSFGPADWRNRAQTELGYWLKLWIDVYDFVSSTAPDRCILLSYDRLCDGTGDIWSSLCSRLNLAPRTAAGSLRHSVQEVDLEVPSDLRERARTVHDRLS